MWAPGNKTGSGAKVELWQFWVKCGPIVWKFWVLYTHLPNETRALEQKLDSGNLKYWCGTTRKWNRLWSKWNDSGFRAKLGLWNFEVIPSCLETKLSSSEAKVRLWNFVVHGLTLSWTKALMVWNFQSNISNESAFLTRKLVAYIFRIIFCLGFMSFSCFIYLNDRLSRFFLTLMLFDLHSRDPRITFFSGPENFGLFFFTLGSWEFWVSRPRNPRVSFVLGFLGRESKQKVISSIFSEIIIFLRLKCDLLS